MSAARRRLGFGLGLLALLVVGGGVGGLLWWQAGERVLEAEIETLVSAARAELGRAELARSEMTALTRRIAEHPAAGDPRLIRAQARLDLALGRVQDALDGHAELAGIDPEPEDLLLNARILKRRHSMRGEPADAARAMRAAEAHHEETGDVASLFLAWQCALRADLQDQVKLFADQLSGDHATTLQGRLLVCLLQDAPPASELRALEIEFARQPTQHHLTAVPEELDFALAIIAMDVADGLSEALERLTRVLATYPSWIDARFAAALAQHRLGNQAGRDGHLVWLLANAPRDDRRRAAWAALQAQPPGK